MKTKKKKVKTKRNNKQCKDPMGRVALGYLISGIFEAVLAIPIMGWLMGVGSFGFFWVVGIIIHAVVVSIAAKEKRATYGNVIGIMANILGWVPVLGWILHVIAAIALFTLFFKEERES